MQRFAVAETHLSLPDAEEETGAAEEPQASEETDKRERRGCP
jgi:hypothetical protein